MNISVKKRIINNLDEFKDYSCLFGSKKELVSLTKKGVSGYTSNGSWLYEEFERNPGLYDKIHGIYVNEVLYIENNERLARVNPELDKILKIESDVFNEINESLNKVDPVLNVSIGTIVKDISMGTGVVVIIDEFFEDRNIFKVKFIEEDSDKLEIYDMYGRHWFKSYTNEPGEWSEYISLGLKVK